MFGSMRAFFAALFAKRPPYEPKRPHMVVEYGVDPNFLRPIGKKGKRKRPAIFRLRASWRDQSRYPGYTIRATQPKRAALYRKLLAEGFTPASIDAALDHKYGKPGVVEVKTAFGSYRVSGHWTEILIPAA